MNRIANLLLICASLVVGCNAAPQRRAGPPAPPVAQSVVRSPLSVVAPESFPRVYRLEWPSQPDAPNLAIKQSDDLTWWYLLDEIYADNPRNFYYVAFGPRTPRKFFRVRSLADQTWLPLTITRADATFLDYAYQFP